MNTKNEDFFTYNIVFHPLELLRPAKEDVAVVLAAVQVLHQLRHNLPLLAAVFSFHGSVHKSEQQRYVSTLKM